MNWTSLVFVTDQSSVIVMPDVESLGQTCRKFPRLLTPLLFGVVADEFLVNAARYHCQTSLFKICGPALKCRMPIRTLCTLKILGSNGPILMRPIYQCLNARFIAIESVKTINEVPNDFGVGAEIMRPVGVNSNAADVNLVTDIAADLIAAINHKDIAPRVC